MENIKIITILLIIVLVVLTVVTICLLVKNRNIIMETFLSNHNCPPYTSDHNAKNSYASKLKGWCATAEFADEQRDNDLLEGYSKSNIKCPPNHYRVSGNESLSYDSKAWCLKSQN